MKTTLGLLWLFLFPLSTLDIITRHDVDDKKLLEYGQQEDFESLAVFKHGNGTLIGESWVVTAEHVTIGLIKGGEVQIKGDTYFIDQVISFPQIGVEDPYKRKDIAMVKLASKVTNAKPVKLIRTPAQKGEMLHLAGTGRIGDGRSVPQQSDRRVRGATNRVDEVNELFITFDFDSPDGKDVTALEGISGFGDSGGPIYIKRNGEVFLAGVSSFQASPDNQTPGGHYGVIEHYVNVHSYLDWIELVMAGKEYFETEVEGKLVKLIIDGEEVMAAPGSEMSTAQIQPIRSDLVATYQRFVEERNGAAINLPRFLSFIQNLAVEAKIIDRPQDVAFVLGENSLTIKGKSVSADAHKSALKLYEDYFGEKLTNGAAVNYDPNG